MKCLISESWSCTRYDDIIKAAELMDIPVKQAFAMRHNFINEAVKGLNQEIEAAGLYLLNCTDELEFRFYIESMAFNTKQIKRLEQARPKKPTECSISGSDIEDARHYPVNKLIEFTHGKATAFCHSDKNPSMFHGNRLNLAVCPVCDKKFGPIDILIERDGYNFIDAVKYLIGG